MEIVFNRESLIDVFSKVITAVPSSAVIPIYANVLFEPIDTKSISISAFDNSEGIFIKAVLDDVKMTKPIAFTLNAKTFNSFIQSSTSDIITIALTKNKKNKLDDEVDYNEGVYKIFDTESYIHIPSISADQFVQFPEISKDNKVEVKSSELLRMIKQTQFVSSVADQRYVMAGINLKVVGDCMELASTDGVRLCISKTALDADFDKASIIIPLKCASILHKLCADSKNDTISLYLDDNSLSIVLDGLEMTTKGIEGAFPPYHKLIIGPFENTFVIDKEVFRRLLKRSEIVLSDKRISITLTITKDKLVISSRSSDIGEGVFTCDAEYDGEPIDLAMVPSILMDVIPVLESEFFELKIKGNESPVLVEGDDNFKYIVYPLIEEL